MQLALNVVIFALGFTCAAVASGAPRKSRAHLERALNNAHYILSAIRAFIARGASPSKESEKGQNRIFTKSEVEQQFETNTWQRQVYDDFKATLLPKNSTFPCVYATKGYRSGQHRYVFLESENPNEARNLRRLSKALHEYLIIAPSLGDNTSLVILAAPPQNQSLTDEDYHKQFWNMLKGLRIADPKQWPSEIPTNTGSERWAFCFDGIPLFVVALTPAHQNRASRQASTFIVAVQPKWILDKLLATPEKRESATSTVRSLLKAYDQVDISPDLTQYGQPGTTEARQLFLLDENKTSECPFEDLND